MTRRWQPPAAVSIAAGQMPNANALLQDLARGLPVSSVTLEAIIASGINGAIGSWATNILTKAEQAESAHITDVLVSSGFDENGCMPQAFGILDPDFDDGERIVAVVRAGARPDTWQRITASGWENCDAPEQMPYVDLRGEVLADALETICAGASLLLRAAEPIAWLSPKADLPVIAAASALVTPANPPAPNADAGGVVYAIVDPLNTSAVLQLFEVTPNGKISVRTTNAWEPDDGTLRSQLTGLNPPPVVTVSPDQVPDVVRQVDDFASTHPATAAGPNGGQAPAPATPTVAPPAPYSNEPPDPTAVSVPPPPAGPAPTPVSASAMSLLAAAVNGDGHSNDVMVALPVHPDVASKMAVDGGESPDALHVTMAYLGDKADLPPHDTLLKSAQAWASHTAPIKGIVSGPGQFTAGQEKPVHVALVDAPALPDARQDLVHHLQNAGATVNSEHGYTPHVSLKFGGGPVPVDNHPLAFDHAALYYGDQVTKLPLGGDADPSALDNWLPSDAEEPLQAALTAASIHHQRRVREAQSADAIWEADRAASDLSEQTKRRNFETMISSRYATLKGEGADTSTAAATVRREIEAENSRRDLWEQQRSDAHVAEKERRLRTQPDMRLSQELGKRISMVKGNPLLTSPIIDASQPPASPVPDRGALAAAAIPHTLLPPALFKYWVAGKGAIKIHWGIKGDWQRCRDHLLKYVKSDYQTKALCAELHKFATGRWTGSKANKEIEGHGL